MPTLLADAGIVVLPSYREGLPKSLIEAAACARPLITTDAPGCREVVTHGVNGLFVPVRNAEALARTIAMLQDDPELARRLGEAARKKALAEFDERVVIARALAVSRNCLLAGSIFSSDGGTSFFKQCAEVGVFNISANDIHRLPPSGLHDWQDGES